MKNYIKLILQKILGLENYLFLFSLFIIKKLTWDRNEKDFLYFLKLLPSNGMVLDIGANIGVMSFYLAKESDERIVHAFEPIPYNLVNLQKIKRRYKFENLMIHPIALGDTEGNAEMILPVKNSVRLHGLAHIHENQKTSEKGELFTCPIRRLDSLTVLLDSGKPIVGIKIDVENFEYHVLNGAIELLKTHKPLIYCELWDTPNRSLTMALLTDLGYKTKILINGALVDFEPEIHETQNFFFVI